MDQRVETVLQSTYRQALYLWIGLSLSLTLFFVQSQLVFVKGKPLPTSQLEWVFTGLGAVTFLMGLVFFKYYLAIRKSRILRMPVNDRKQTILLAFVFQFVLFETLGLYGVLLSVLTQNTMKAFPFVVFAYVGFLLALPKKIKIKEFFLGSEI